MDVNTQHALNGLLSNCDLHKIVTFDERTKRIYIGGEAADAGKLANLKAEADFLMQTDLWALLTETPRALAERAMFVQGETLDDLKKGRTILYTIATQKKIVETLASYAPKEPLRPKA